MTAVIEVPIVHLFNNVTTTVANMPTLPPEVAEITIQGYNPVTDETWDAFRVRGHITTPKLFTGKRVNLGFGVDAEGFRRVCLDPVGELPNTSPESLFLMYKRALATTRNRGEQAQLYGCFVALRCLGSGIQIKPSRIAQPFIRVKAGTPLPVVEA